MDKTIIKVKTMIWRLAYPAWKSQKGYCDSEILVNSDDVLNSST